MQVFRVLMICCLCCVAVAESPDDADRARAELETRGLYVRGDAIVLRAETRMGRGLHDARAAGRDLVRLERVLERQRKQQRDDAAEIIELKHRWADRSADLARINRNDVLANNRLVGELNALRGRIDALQEQRRARQEQMALDRKAAAQAREAFLEAVGEVRAVADEVLADYERLAVDPDVATAIERLAEVEGKPYELAPTSAFESAVRRLERLEQGVQSGEIPLRSASGVLFAEVVLNGDHTREMMVDSGAAFVGMPQSMAHELGLRVTESDPRVVLQLADGRQIEAAVIVLDSVRVGEFEARDVDCVVLGPDAPNADPLLGMSFLRRFQFHLDPQAAVLSLKMVELDRDSPKP